MDSTESKASTVRLTTTPTEEKGADDDDAGRTAVLGVRADWHTAKGPFWVYAARADRDGGGAEHGSVIWDDESGTLPFKATRVVRGPREIPFSTLPGCSTCVLGRRLLT